MLNAPTIQSYAKLSSVAFVEHCLLSSSLESNSKPLSHKSIFINEHFIDSGKSKASVVNKTYEMYKGALCESYFDISDNDEAKEFIEDYIRNLNKGIIMVIDNQTKIDDVIDLSTGIHKSIKLIINYNCDSMPNQRHIANIPQINTLSVKNAVNIAYSNVENGQSILFAHVSSKFDLFEHTDII